MHSALAYSGNGKTEMIRSLSQTLGEYIVFFNCSDQYSVSDMERVFKVKRLSELCFLCGERETQLCAQGTAQSGAWVCFDDVNRLPRTVRCSQACCHCKSLTTVHQIMSALSLHIHCLLSAQRSGASSCTFVDGTTLKFPPPSAHYQVQCTGVNADSCVKQRSQRWAYLQRWIRENRAATRCAVP